MFIFVIRILLGIPAEDHVNNISLSMYIVNTCLGLTLFIARNQVFAKAPPISVPRVSLALLAG